MRTEITMPRLSDTMSEGTVDRWVKQPGDQVHRDELIAEIQTDKAVMELVAFDDGVLDEIVVPAGRTVPIGEVIGWIRSGSDAKAGSAAASSKSAAPAAAPSQPAAPAAEASQPARRTEAPAAQAPAAQSTAQPAARTSEPAASAQAQPADAPRVKASPLAKRIAEANDVDLRALQGTGPGGRIIRENVEQFLTTRSSAAAQAPSGPSAATTTGPATLTRIERATARSVSQSKPGIPHIYLSIDVDMGAAEALRRQINDSGVVALKISPNDIIVKAVGHALTLHRRINSRYATAEDGGPDRQDNAAINVSVAAATEHGLFAPVVRDVDKKTIGTIAGEIRELVERARAGKSRQADLEGATFQTSNLGMFGVREFVSIITPPQAGSLSIGAIRQVPVVRDGSVVAGQVLTLTLSLDHRIVDGAAGAAFLADLRRLLESPLSLLL